MTVNSRKVFHCCGGCKKCKHTWNLTIYERTKVARIPAGEYELFVENDRDLACKYGNDVDFLKRNKAELK